VRLVAALLLTLTLGVAGCTSETGDRPGRGEDPSTSGPSATGSSSTAVARAPQPPPRRGCYRLRFGQLARPTNDSRPVPCNRRHVVQTVHVGRVDTVVDGHAVAVDSRHVREQIARECPRRAAATLGGSRADRDLSRLRAVWFAPTLGQSDAGANWYRCDVVALAGPDRLHPLPPPRRLAGILGTEQGRSTYGLCGTAEPGTPAFERTICARPHRWRAIDTIRLPGGRAYPGVATVRAEGDEACADVARAAADDPLRFRYGWEWPTRAQWRSGQRFGYCWIPD
jgi:hypothetical protein